MQQPELRWTTGKDFDQLLDFYVTELVKCPDYIAHPELRDGVKNEPEKWMAQLKAAAIGYFTDTFNPKSGMRVAVLEVPEVNGKRPSKKAQAEAKRKIIAFLRLRLTPPSGTLMDILVAETHRNKGLGSQLVQFTNQGMASEGIREINLSVSVQNADAARFFVRNEYMPYATFFAKALTPPEPRVHRIPQTHGLGAPQD